MSFKFHHSVILPFWTVKCERLVKKCSILFNDDNVKQKRSTEGCSKLKSPETRQVQERLVSTLEHIQVPKWDRITGLLKSLCNFGQPNCPTLTYNCKYRIQSLVIKTRGWITLSSHFAV